MLLDDLKIAFFQNRDKNPVFLRNILKEIIQYYILDFISKSTYTEYFLFKGGTCLRICFDLPRLSEDLDFDIENIKSFKIEKFLTELRSYFIKTWQFTNFTIKLAGNRKTIYLKFPILKDIGIEIKRNETNILFVRLDLSEAIGRKYKTEISIKSIRSFSFLIKRYSLSDLFAGKISAILTRETMEEKTRKERFKGRDFYDLIWFLEKKTEPNWKFLREITGFTKEEAIKKLTIKIEKVKPSLLKTDLTPFFEDTNFVENFCTSFQELYQQYKTKLG